MSAPWNADDQPSDEELFQKFSRQVGNESEKLWESIFRQQRSIKGEDEITFF